MHSSFAARPADKKAAYSAAIKKRSGLFHCLFKTSPDDHSNVSKDYFELPTLNRQDIKKVIVPCIFLFHSQEYKAERSAPVKIYTAQPRLNYKFIQQCLYPKHVFW
ncbi:hypothetical protein ACSBL2_22820 [Pedobacter sp. AW31-3R]|uniref:hypothetical protein n=1 Tax=Pedobacter sp. AW31-3R TaxID=3445781 RepID=UPI003F9F3DBC